MSKYLTTVRQNDRLSDIAERFTGDPSLWFMIVQVNDLPKTWILYQGKRIATLTSISVGQKLYIPDSWIEGKGSVSGSLSGCSSCGKRRGGGCNSCGNSHGYTCSGGCDYPYGNRDNPSAPCGAFDTCTDLGTCGKMRTGAHLMGTVSGAIGEALMGTVGEALMGDIGAPVDNMSDIRDQEIQAFLNMSPSDCKTWFSNYWTQLQNADPDKFKKIHDLLIKKYGSDEEINARGVIVAQVACNDKLSNINPQPIYSKPTNWIWLGGAALAGLLVGKFVL